jgi:hypothetical protein
MAPREALAGARQRTLARSAPRVAAFALGWRLFWLSQSAADDALPHVEDLGLKRPAPADTDH